MTRHQGESNELFISLLMDSLNKKEREKKEEGKRDKLRQMGGGGGGGEWYLKSNSGIVVRRKQWAFMLRTQTCPTCCHTEGPGLYKTLH